MKEIDNIPFYYALFAYCSFLSILLAIIGQTKQNFLNVGLIISYESIAWRQRIEAQSKASIHQGHTSLPLSSGIRTNGYKRRITKQEKFM